MQLLEETNSTSKKRKPIRDERIKESMTSLPLQMALHYNAVASPFIFIVSIASFIYKYRYLSPTYRVILIAVHIVHVLIEAIRLVLGYTGNLGEKIPSLSGFWITSLLLQLPISIFLGVNPDILPLPSERFLYALHVIFLVIEIILGYTVIRRIGEYHVRQFKAAVLKEEEEEGREKQN